MPWHPEVAGACFLGRESEGRDEVRWMLDDVCSVVENSVLGIGRMGAGVSCHVGCSASSGLGHSGVSKSGSMMKRVRFDAFDDLAVWAWSSLRGQSLRRLSSFLLSNSDAQNAITLTELQSKKHSFFHSFFPSQQKIFIQSMMGI